MTCRFIRNEDGTTIIVCSGGNTLDEMSELKKAMSCKRWEICEKCDSYQICQNVLAKRKETENAKGQP